MNLEKHISELLFEHDCVIVPDFGGFVCNYSAASIHSSKHTFQPPFKKISFNQNLKNNDGLLANHVSQTDAVSYADANHLISEYVKNLNNELLSQKRFDFKNIGTFCIGEEDTLLFEQDLSVNYLQESFGLSSFYSPIIKREAIERKLERKLKDKIFIPSKEKAGAVPSKRKTARYLLATATVLLISFLVWVPLQSDLFKNVDYSSLNPFASKALPLYQAVDIDIPEPDRENLDVSSVLAMAPDTTKYLNIVIGGKIPIVIQLKENATAVVKTNNHNSLTIGRFQIIGGVFAVSDNAERMFRKLKKAGYNASIIDKKGKPLRFVSYGGFNTKKEALQTLRTIRNIQEDVWLMRN